MFNKQITAEAVPFSYCRLTAFFVLYLRFVFTTVGQLHPYPRNSLDPPPF